MRAIYFKITNDLFFYNKKTLILFCALPFITSLITLTINGNKISIIDFFLPICFLVSGALVISRIIKAKDLKFQKFSSDKNVYGLSSKKYKNQCYNESINRISQNEITVNNLHINEDKEISKFLTNFNLSFIEKLKKSITFERFDEYLITNNSNKTSGNLFFTLYKKSLLKIIKDFIINTDYLKNASDNTKQQFINELTNLKNLHFNQNKGLHYDDKFVFEFLEKNNNQKTTIQENVTIYDNEQLKIKNISIFNFYRILSTCIKDVCNLELNRKENRELKSFVGLYFKSNKEGTITFEKEFQKLSFTNEKNYKKFILIMKHLTELHHVEIHESKLSRILKRCISEISFPNEVKDRTESIRQYYRNADLSNIQKEKINSILQSFLKNKT